MAAHQVTLPRASVAAAAAVQGDPSLCMAAWLASGHRATPPALSRQPPQLPVVDNPAEVPLGRSGVKRRVAGKRQCVKKCFSYKEPGHEVADCLVLVSCDICEVTDILAPACPVLRILKPEASLYG